MTALTTVALAGVAAPAAQAADDCPNADVRAQQNATHLPNCMAYEKVTPHEKGGARPTPGIAITGDGTGLLYDLNAGIQDAQSFVAGRYRARRTSTGWTTNGIAPAFDGEQLPLLDDIPLVWDTSSDLSRQVFGTNYGINPNDQGVRIPAARVGSTDLYLRDADGSFTWLVPNPSEVSTEIENVTFADASADLDRVVLQTVRPFDARTTDSGVAHIYVWSAEHGMVLVSELPDGSPAAEVDAVRETTGNRPATRQTFGVSPDGRRVVFTVGTQLYARFDADDPGRAVTREVAVGPNGERCQADASPYRALSADGSKLVFYCGIGSGADTLARGVYVRDLDGGPQAVQRVGDADGDAVVQGGTSDFSRFYYVAGVFDSRLVRVDDGVGREIVAAAPDSGIVQYREPAVSVDGEYVSFMTDKDVGAAPPGVPAGVQQVYLYSARTDDLTCVSCRQDGGATDGEALLYNIVTPVNNKGSVPFNSTSALVPEDTNGKMDAYAWIDGRAVLLSSGTSGSDSTAYGSSADGSLFLVTGDALVRDDVDGGADDLYVARENGGVLVPDAPAPCVANCQDSRPQAPGLPRIVTGELLPGGNLVENDEKPASRASVSFIGSRSLKGSRATVRVKVSAAGSIRVSGAGLRPTTVKVKKAGTYRVTVRLSAFGAKQQKKRGRLATQATARFTPTAGASVSVRKSVTFTATKKGGR